MAVSAVGACSIYTRMAPGSIRAAELRPEVHKRTLPHGPGCGTNRPRIRRASRTPGEKIEKYLASCPRGPARNYDLVAVLVIIDSIAFPQSLLNW
jgi:hypothetical protein